MVRVFENRVLRLIMEPKWTEIYGRWGKLDYAEVHHSYPPHKILLHRLYQGGRDGQRMWHSWEIREK